MFLFIFKDHMFDHVSLWHRCIVGYPYLLCVGRAWLLQEELKQQTMDGRLVT